MYKHPKYPLLFSPLKINKLVLKNRIFYAPVEAYYDRALSGCAVMMRGTSGTLRDPKCRMSPGKWLFEDSEMPRVKEELMLIKRAGALTSMEIMHAGIGACVPAEGYVIGPSDGTREDGTPIRGMDEEMMAGVIDEFVETAVIAKKIGYDMVMLHFAHGWLPSQFFAASINKRTDEYGGSYENRFRFAKRILTAMRNALGFEYTIDMRISAYENFEGCAAAEEVIRFIKEVSDEGLIDMVNVSFGGHLASRGTYAGPFAPDMCYADYAKAIKENVNIPVVVVGKIMTPEQAEQILEEGKADAVVIGRASIADPWWAKKAFECRSEDIIPCILCGKCFDKRCSVQLRNYHEHMVPLKLKKTKNPQKVVVAGGGPAGMRAAVTADQKGHKVILFEATDRLGGLTKAADYDENKRELKRYKDYLINQLNKSNVKIKLNTLATPETIAKERPDRLILALGSIPIIPNIKGIEFAHQIIEMHERIDEIGDNVVIIGGGLVGSEFAGTLALRQKKVVLIEKTDAIAGKYDNTTFSPYDFLCTLDNVKLMPNGHCVEIKEKSVIISSEEAGEEEIEADTVILSVGFKSNNEGIDTYFGITPETITIGDLRRPATIRECEEEGYFSISEI